MPNASCPVSSLAPVTQRCESYNKATGLSLIDRPTVSFPQSFAVPPMYLKQIGIHAYKPTNKQKIKPTYICACTHTNINTQTHTCNRFPSYDYQFCFHEHLLVMEKTVDSLRGKWRHTQDDVSSIIIPTTHGTSLCALSTRKYLYSHASHNDVNSINNRPHIGRWSHNIIIQYYNTYHCVTIAYSIQYSNMLYRFVA
jgi:hypothetical protein